MSCDSALTHTWLWANLPTGRTGRAAVGGCVAENLGLAWGPRGTPSWMEAGGQVGQGPAASPGLRAARGALSTSRMVAGHPTSFLGASVHFSPQALCHPGAR